MRCPHCGQEVILKSNTRLTKPKVEEKASNPKPKAGKEEIVAKGKKGKKKGKG